jgi:hypothetical protein
MDLCVIRVPLASLNFDERERMDSSTAPRGAVGRCGAKDIKISFIGRKR